jgi:hypothetical protein
MNETINDINKLWKRLQIEFLKNIPWNLHVASALL